MPPWLSSARHHQYIILTNWFFNPIPSCKPLYVSCANIYLLCIPCNKKANYFHKKVVFLSFRPVFPPFSTFLYPYLLLFRAGNIFFPLAACPCSCKKPCHRNSGSSSPSSAPREGKAQQEAAGRRMLHRCRHKPPDACGIRQPQRCI